MAEELTDGRLYLTIRNGVRVKPTGHKAEGFSADCGECWSPVRLQPQMPGMTYQSAIVRWVDPKDPTNITYIFTGITLDTNSTLKRFPAHPGAKGRQRLAVYVSKDECESWKEAGEIFPATAAYSDLVVLPNGEVLCFFEAGEKISHESVRMTRLKRDWFQ